MLLAAALTPFVFDKMLLFEREPNVIEMGDDAIEIGPPTSIGGESAFGGLFPEFCDVLKKNWHKIEEKWCKKGEHLNFNGWLDPWIDNSPKTRRRRTGTTRTRLRYRLMIMHLYGWWLRPIQIGIGTWALSRCTGTQAFVIIVTNYIRRWVTTSVILYQDFKHDLKLKCF